MRWPLPRGSNADGSRQENIINSRTKEGINIYSVNRYATGRKTYVAVFSTF